MLCIEHIELCLVLSLIVCILRVKCILIRIVAISQICAIICECELPTDNVCIVYSGCRIYLIFSCADISHSIVNCVHPARHAEIIKLAKIFSSLVLKLKCLSILLLISILKLLWNICSSLINALYVGKIITGTVVFVCS